MLYKITSEIDFAAIQKIISEGQKISLSGEAKTKIIKCRNYLDKKLSSFRHLTGNNRGSFYGINTGFGALHNTIIPENELEKLQENLVMSHACGTGEEVPQEIVKLLLLLKIQSLALGYSGVSLKLVERLIEMFNRNILPVVYQQGSLGASGDLSPLAHISLPLIGKGEVYFRGKKYCSADYKSVLPHHKFKSREALALLNGTQFMSAYGVWVLLKAKHLADCADVIGAISLDAFNGKIEPFNELIHKARPHKGQITVAKKIRTVLSGSQIIRQNKEFVQDPYSFRCIPQVHGASRDAIEYAENVFLTEINSVTDNPTLFPAQDEIISAGNFHGQPLAIALDLLAIAIAELGSISERRTYQLISGQRELPPFLVANPGLNSGFMLPQYTAASIVSQNKQLCTPASVDSIVSSNGQEDHVSMGANAATKCFQVVNNLEKILAVELFTAAQALEFRHPLKPSPVVAKIISDYRKKVKFIKEDKVMYEEIEKTRIFLDKMKTKIIATAILLLLVFDFRFSFSQNYIRTDTIPVKVNGNFLKNPWVGGLNFVQLSTMDLNFDGIPDLVVFDRTGHKITTYINGGTPNTVDYIHAPVYESKFPHIEDWMLIRDYNCDGLPDIFTYAINLSGIRVWKNTSSAGNLQFTMQTPYIQSNYNPTVSNIYVSRVDVPTIDDVDGDGDLDILTFNISSTILEYHINKSKELGYGCDSLIFQLDPSGCWGHFTEPFTAGCSAYLNTCRIANPDSGALTPSVSAHQLSVTDYQLPDTNYRYRHAGNCSLSFDLDGDGDKDILLGQLNCCNMIMLTNGGTSSAANMIAKDTAFPSYNIPAALTAFPCGYFLDVNNDNKRDLIVAPNAPSISINNESIWYYENIGTDSAPVFSRKKRNLLQDEMIDVGAGANPVFFDFNNDGLLDLLIANDRMVIDSCNQNYLFGVFAFQNIGTPTSPKFTLITTDFANLSSVLPNFPGKHLTFADLDGDGDKDMFIGDENGFIHYFENTGGIGPANFSTPPVLNYTDNTGVPIDIGSNATPQLIDVDRDGDYDLIIGEFAGNLNYYENTGTPFIPSFKFITSNFGGVDVLKPCCTGYSVPFMYDSSGSYRLIVASEANKNNSPMGWLWYYKNIDGNLAGNFTLVDSMYKNIWEGTRMTIHGADINNDGLLDLVIGNYAGGVAIYMGDTAKNTSVHELSSYSFDFSVFPNPSSGNFRIMISDLRFENAEVEIYNVFGEKVYSEKISNHKSVIINLEHPKGIYFCTVRTDHFIRTKKIVIVK